MTPVNIGCEYEDRLSGFRVRTRVVGRAHGQLVVSVTDLETGRYLRVQLVSFIRRFEELRSH